MHLVFLCVLSTMMQDKNKQVHYQASVAKIGGIFIPF
jgi:hypothetical protein